MNKAKILVTASSIAVAALVIVELGISTVAFAGGGSPITGPITGPINPPVTGPVTPPIGTPTPTPSATPVATPTPRPTATPKPTHTPKPTATPKPTHTPKPTATPRPTLPPEDLMHGHRDDDHGYKFGLVIQRWIQVWHNWFSHFSHR